MIAIRGIYPETRIRKRRDNQAADISCRQNARGPLRGDCGVNPKLFQLVAQFVRSFAGTAKYARFGPCFASPRA